MQLRIRGAVDGRVLNSSNRSERIKMSLEHDFELEAVYLIFKSSSPIILTLPD